jgi:hypothetical protein
MANPYRGEVEIPVPVTDPETGAKTTKTYKLRFGTNELAELEDAFGTLNAFFGSFKKDQLSVVNLRKAVKIALKRCHPELSLDDVGDLFDQVGFRAMNDAIVKGFKVGTEILLGEEDEPEPDPNAAAAAGASPTS